MGGGPGGALAAGLVAGYGLVLPMGAISVLIVHEGLTRGWRTAWAAASGTSLVDLGYVCLALGLGTAASDRLQEHTRAIRVVGAAVLVAVAARGLLALRSPPEEPTPGTAAFGTPTSGTATAGTAAAFAAGVFTASWSWCLLLAATGSAAGARLPVWARPVTSVAGYVVVLGYAVTLAMG